MLSTRLFATPKRDSLAWEGLQLGFGQCLVLWGLFWLNFVVSYWHGLPYGSTKAYALNYFDRVEGYPWSLSGVFLGVALAASVVALLVTWCNTVGKPGKWRIRGMVLVFSIICSGYAGVMKASEGYYVWLAHQVVLSDQEWLKKEKSFRSPEWVKWKQEQIKWQIEYLKTRK